MIEYTNKMPTFLALGLAVVAVVYLCLQFLISVTQNAREPRLAESMLPFLDPVIGIARQRAGYLANLG